MAYKFDDTYDSSGDLYDFEDNDEAYENNTPITVNPEPVVTLATEKKTQKPTKIVRNLIKKEQSLTLKRINSYGNIIINDRFQISLKEIENILFHLYLQTLTLNKDKTDAVLRQASEPDFNYLRKIKLNTKSVSFMERHLTELFEKSLEPAWLNLLIIENSKDYQSIKSNSFAVKLSKIFEKWSQAHRDKLKLTNELKKHAFIVATRPHVLLVDSISQAYDLQILDDDLKNYVLDTIKCLEHKDQALIISSLKLYENFELESIVIPLLIQDQMNILEIYLNKSKTTQKAFVSYLDTLCGRHPLDDSQIYFNYDRYFDDSFLNKDSLKLDRITYRQISKLALRLVKQYELNATSCPNISREQNYKNLKYLMYKKYVDKSIYGEAWNELVELSLKQSPELKYDFMSLIHQYGDYDSLYEWYKRIDVDPSRLSSSINYYLSDDFAKKSQIDENFSSNDKYYQLKISHNSIKIVDTVEKLHLMLDEFENSDVSLVAIDCEWKPACTVGASSGSNKIALFQIATRTHIYLVDLLVLLDVLSEFDANRLFKVFLCNQNLIKLGYGISQDIKMMTQSFHLFKLNHVEFMKSTVDLGVVVNEVLMHKNGVFEHSGDENGDTGLSRIVRMCFGKGLNKSEQMSNWEKRPLRREQIVYAALDAFCIMNIIDLIEEKLNIKMDLSIYRGRKLKSQAKQVVGVVEHTLIESQEQPFMRSHDLKVVCDNMLQGLGKELRHCGVDTLIIENEDDHLLVAKLARKHNRYALSCGAPFQSIKSQLPDGKCIYIESGNAKTQCAQVLNKFNVRIEKDDLFSRCQNCNTASYINANQHDLKLLWYSHKNDQKKLEEDVDMNKCKIQTLIDLKTMEFKANSSVKVKIESVFLTTLNAIDFYYICAGCGQIFWEGPHWQNISTRFSYCLNNNYNKKV